MENLFLKKKTVTMIVAMGLVVILALTSFSGLVGSNDSGFYQVKQSFPAGNMSVISNAGMYVKMFSKMTEYKISDTYFYSKNDLDGGSGAESAAILVRFAGGGTADIDGSVKYRLPATEEGRLQLHEDFTSDEAIMQDLVSQYVQEALKNTATLFKPEDTYSGKKGEFNAVFQAQLEKGIYKTTSKQIITEDAEGNRLTDTIVEIINDKDGNPIIDKISPFKTYGIQLIQVSVKDIDYDDKIDELIKAKQNSEQQKVVARAAAEKAKQDAITAEEEGKAEIARAKAKADVEKETATVKAQQEKEVAELKAQQEKAVAELDAQKKLTVAELNAQSAEKDAEALLTKKEAEAKANRLLVQAGLTPLQKAQIEKEIAIGVAKELAKANVPSVYVAGGSDGMDISNPLTAMGIESILNVIDKMEN